MAENFLILHLLQKLQLMPLFVESIRLVYVIDMPIIRSISILRYLACSTVQVGCKNSDQTGCNDHVGF